MIKSCQKAARLISDSMERPLPAMTRFRLWLHLKMCRLCSGYARDQRALRQLTQAIAEDSPDSIELSEESRIRLRRLLRDRGLDETSTD